MWQRLGKEDPNTWHEVMVPATSTGTYVDGLRTGEAIVFAARYINSAGIPGLWSAASQVITGKSAAPTNVTGLTATKVTNGVRIDWATCPDLDYDETELRKDGTGWSDATPLVGSVFMGISGNSYLWVPVAGTYTIRAKHRDTSGNESATAASVAVTVSAADLIEWGDVSGRPKLFRAMSRGLGDAAAPFAGFAPQGGLADGETGTLLYDASNMYRVFKINRSSGAVTDLGSFITLGGGTAVANAMAAAIETVDANHVLVVVTWDEPQGDRLLGNLPETMYRYGASRAVFGAPGTGNAEPGSRFKYRSAYILVAIGKCGEGNGFEAYSGSGDSDTNAWCDVSFYLQNGNLVISGTSATPRTLADYSYTGAMNATYGATWGVNIGGSNKPADNATVGATWSSNITSQPADSTLMNSYVGGNLYPSADVIAVPNGVYGLGVTTLKYGSDNRMGFLPGEVLTLSADVWCADGSTAAAGQNATLFLYTAQSGGAWTQSATVINSGTNRQRGSANVTLPADADMYHIAVGLFHQGTNASSSPTGVIYADRIQVERGHVATQYQPRTVSNEITTPKIASNSVTYSIVNTTTGGTLYSGTAASAINPKKDGPQITTARSDSRVMGMVFGNIKVQFNTTAQRIIHVATFGRLRRVSDDVLMDETEPQTTDGWAYPITNNQTTLAIGGSFVFDAQAVGTYYVQLGFVISSYDTSRSLQANITAVYWDGEITAVEFKV
jgi:hypothetical protein